MLGALLLIFHYVRIYLRTEKYLVKWVDLSSCRKIGYQSTSQNGGQYFSRCNFFKKFIQYHAETRLNVHVFYRI